jgi:opacity protein-like surface antigen
MKKTVLAATSLILLSSTVFAQTATPRFDQRQANQERRIDQGVASGQLTQREAARLDKGQDRMQRMEDKAKSDGTVTRQERARLQHAENVQSRHIAREKHDRQRDLNHDGRKDRPARRN